MKRYPSILILLAALFLAPCSAQPATPDPLLATISALETEQARLSTQLMAIKPTATRPESTLTPTTRATRTPLISPTPTFDLNSPSVLFVGTDTCTVKAVSVSGGQAITLTLNSPLDCKGALISPDGQKALYSIQEGNPDDFTQSLYVMNVDGSSPVTILDRAQYLYLVDWSPDSNWLSYVNISGENQAGPILSLNLVRADGTGRFRLTDERAGSIEPVSDVVSWSPDGLWLAFVGDKIPRVIRSDGSGLAKLSDDQGYVSMTWSPDSRQVAYCSPDGAGIAVVDLQGNRRLIQNPSLAVPDMGGILAWTPDGTQMLVYDLRQQALVLVSLDGQQITPLVNVTGYVSQMAWSPDGSLLAFLEQSNTSNNAGTLKVVNADGSGSRILASEVDSNVPFVWKMPGAGQTAPTPIALTPPTPTITPSPTLAGTLGDGLRLYYNFDDDPEGFVRDWSGNGLDGVLNGGDYFPSFGSNKALSFSGTSIEVSNPFQDMPPEQITIALFFKSMMGGVFPGTLLAWSDGHFSGIYLDSYMYWRDGNTDELIEGTGADLIGLDASGSFEDHYITTTSLRSAFESSQAGWHHLVITYDHNTGLAQLYIDGKLDTSKALGNFVPLTSGDDLTIGEHPAQSGTEFVGRMDEIRIYDRVLSAAEIKKLSEIKPPE